MIVREKEGNIINQYFNEAFENNRLFSIELDIAKVCNADCIFCFQGVKNELARKHMDLNNYETLLIDAKKIGGYYIGISGGEPFCNSQAIEIMKLAQRLGYRVGVITNAHLITDTMINELIDMKLSRISISFHAYKKETYAKHFKVNESYYDSTLMKIKKLIEGGCHIGIAFTVTKYNIGEFYDMKNMFIHMGLKESDIKFNMLLHGNIDTESMYPTWNQISLAIAKDPCYFSKKELHEEYDLLCSAARCSFSVNVYGDVFPCSFFNTKAGNVLDDSIVNIWNDSHLFKMFRNLTREMYHHCHKCKNLQKCNFCIVDNLNSTGIFYVPNEGKCEEKIKYQQLIKNLY